MSVEPEPAKRSSTASPGSELYSMARRDSSTGFSVRWTIEAGLTFLTRPEVGHVGRPEEAVGGALLPAVEAPLVVAHEVLAREDRVLLVPDDRLAEVEPGASQGGRVVGDVGVAAPDVEARRPGAGPGRRCRTRPPAAPRTSSSVTKSFVERAVLGAQLAVGRLRLLGMTLSRASGGGGCRSCRAPRRSRVVEPWRRAPRRVRPARERARAPRRWRCCCAARP